MLDKKWAFSERGDTFLLTPEVWVIKINVPFSLSQVVSLALLSVSVFSPNAEVHPGSQEPGQHHPAAQTLQPLSISNRTNKLEVCRRLVEGMQK